MNAPLPCFAKPIYNEEEETKKLELIEKNKFELIYNNVIYDTILSKTINNKYLVIQSYQRDNKYNIYEVFLKYNDLIKLNKTFKVCESIDDAYKLIFNLFNEKKVFIQDTLDYKVKILNFSIINILNGEEQKMEIELKNNNKDSYIMNEFGDKYNDLIENVNNLKKENENIKNTLNVLEKDKLKMEKKIQIFEDEMNNIKKENENLKKEIELLKSYIKPSDNKKCDFITNSEIKKINPLNLTFKKVISESAYCPCVIDNTFTVFKSRINNNILLVYGCKNNCIKCDDLVDQKNIKTIESAHNNNIISIKYFNDIINNKDLILSLSSFDKIIKIWDANNWECIVTMNTYDKNSYSFITSACLLFSEEEKNIYIITSSDSEYDDIKLFNFQGNGIGKISNSKEDKSYYLDIYFDKKQKKHYIISGNNKNVKSYDFSMKTIYKKYCDKKSNNDHMSAKIYEKENKINLIESSIDGIIYIWNFHTAENLKIIKCCKGIQLRGICVWDENNIFIGGDDNSIKLIDIKKRKIIKKSYWTKWDNMYFA